MNLDSSELMRLIWSQLWQVTLVIVMVAMLIRLACRRRPHLAHGL